MPSSSEPLLSRHRFQNDIDNLAVALINAFGLKFAKEKANLSSPLLRWLDFRQRYVDPYPRPVAFSDQFPKRALPPSAQAGLRQLVERFKSGRDVNPYQGRGLILRHDTSGKNSLVRTDLLFADWNILHFHLSDEPIPPERFFSKSADYLAFCLVGGNVAAFIDVLPHPDKVEFANYSLFETIARSWPDYIDQYKINGVSASTNPSTIERSILREAGINNFTSYQGISYQGPGAGITSACTALHTTIVNDRVRESVKMLGEMVDDPLGQFRTNPHVKAIPNHEFSLKLDTNGLVVREEASMTHFALPRPSRSDEITWLGELNDTFAPIWATQLLFPPDSASA